MSNKGPDFWGKKDFISLARSLRLAVVRNVLAQNLISEEDAKEILAGPLSPEEPLTIFDDSEWLTTPFDTRTSDEQHVTS